MSGRKRIRRGRRAKDSTDGPKPLFVALTVLILIAGHVVVFGQLIQQGDRVWFNARWGSYVSLSSAALILVIIDAILLYLAFDRRRNGN